MTIGEIVARRRIELNMSQADLATKIGVVRSTVSCIETGRNKVKGEMLSKLRGALCISMDELLGRSEYGFSELRLPVDFEFYKNLIPEMSDSRLNNFIHHIQADPLPMKTKGKILELALHSKANRINETKNLLYLHIDEWTTPELKDRGQNVIDACVSLAAELCFICGSPEAAKDTLDKHKTDGNMKNRLRENTLAGSEAIV